MPRRICAALRRHIWLRCTLVHKVAYNKHRSAPQPKKRAAPALLPHSGFYGAPTPLHPSCGALAKVCLTDAHALGMASVRQTLARCLLHISSANPCASPRRVYSERHVFYDVHYSKRQSSLYFVVCRAGFAPPLGGVFPLQIRAHPPGGL